MAQIFFTITYFHPFTKLFMSLTSVLLIPFIQCSYISFQQRNITKGRHHLIKGKLTGFIVDEVALRLCISISSPRVGNWMGLGQSSYPLVIKWSAEFIGEKTLKKSGVVDLLFFSVRFYSCCLRETLIMCRGSSSFTDQKIYKILEKPRSFIQVQHSTKHPDEVTMVRAVAK